MNMKLHREDDMDRGLAVRRTVRSFVSAAALSLAAMGIAFGQSGEPIKIGFGMSLTGPLSANGKSSLLAM
jgi:branched-chain amino acid transport system substrate-binding protein